MAGMTKWSEHREAVAETLKRRGKNTAWLVEQVKPKLSRNLLYTYLRGECDITTEKKQRINKILGIKSFYTDE